MKEKNKNSMIVKHTTTRKQLDADNYRSISVKREGDIPKDYDFGKLILVMQQMITEKNDNLFSKREENVA
ncbi:MAG: hypothetical protein J6K70_01525 [Selenomonadales bacterium]|nr:hypothetical protein [Selenomonadales bacterium]